MHVVKHDLVGKHKTSSHTLLSLQMYTKRLAFSTKSKFSVSKKYIVLLNCLNDEMTIVGYEVCGRAGEGAGGQNSVEEVP